MPCVHAERRDPEHAASCTDTLSVWKILKVLVAVTLKTLHTAGGGWRGGLSVGVRISVCVYVLGGG